MGLSFDRDRRAWYFDKRLSLDTIVGIIGISVVVGGPFIIWGRAMESRVLSIETILSERLTMEKSRDDSQREVRLATDNKIGKLDEKLTKVDENMTQIRVTLARLESAIDHQSRHDERRDNGR